MVFSVILGNFLSIGSYSTILTKRLKETLSEMFPKLQVQDLRVLALWYKGRITLCVFENLRKTCSRRISLLHSSNRL